MTDPKIEKLKTQLSTLSGLLVFSLLCGNERRSVLKIPVRSKDIEPLWRGCRDLFPETGFWPVASWEHAFQHLEIYGMPSESHLNEVLKKGDSFDLEEWFLKERTFWKQRLGPESYEAHLADCHGDWPSENKSWYRWSPFFIDPPEGDPCILLVEAAESWHVPAVLGVHWLGGPNGLTEPEVHVGMLKHLHCLYGAELRTLATDSFTVGTTCRPSTKDEAMKLACEFNLYAPDLIGEIVDSLEKLAATLMSTADWFFWWD